MIETFFDIILLDEAWEFMEGLDTKVSAKIMSNIRRSQRTIDPELFKKISDQIWEFRTRYMGVQYRLLAFWDKNDTENTLVIATHGIVKKQNRMPMSDIEKAKNLRIKYFSEKR